MGLFSHNEEFDEKDESGETKAVNDGTLSVEFPFLLPLTIVSVFQAPMAVLLLLATPNGLAYFMRV